MNANDAFLLASEKSVIVRERKNLLYTFGATRLPYICISESPRGKGETIIRNGEVAASPPKIALPGQSFKFEGFDFDGEEGELARIVLGRSIHMQAADIVNKSESTTTEQRDVESAVEIAVNGLDRRSDSRTAVIIAPEKVWNFSVLLYVGNQIIRSAPSNVSEHVEHLRLRG